MSKRARLWAATLFDPRIADREHLVSCVERGDLTYWCGQCEICPVSQRPHLQFFLCLDQPRTLVGVKRLMFVSEHLKTVHLSLCRGSADDNRTYCSKLESVDPSGAFAFFEAGVFLSVPERNGQGERTDLYKIGRAICEGGALVDIAEANPDLFIKYHRGLENLQTTVRCRPRLYDRDAPYTPPEVYWFYGSSGSGKSREAFARAHDCEDRPFYSKSAGNKWWCGYYGQPIVILDDFRCDWFTFSYLIRLLDCYPMSVEVKGGQVHMNADTFYITCPMRPEHLFAKLAANEDGRILQLTRRITEIRLFGDEPAPPNPYVEGFHP